MGKVNNQNFVPIPTGRLIARLKQLASEYGIVATLTEEAYTSKASFLDGDSLHKFGEKPNGWKPSGRRIERGLYKTAKGLLINADANGAANIARKVATQLGVSLVEVGRAVLTTPQRYDLFIRLDKSYRRRCPDGLLAPMCNNSLESPVLLAGGNVKSYLPPRRPQTGSLWL
jgi:transposase